MELIWKGCVFLYIVLQMGVLDALPLQYEGLQHVGEDDSEVESSDQELVDQPGILQPNIQAKHNEIGHNSVSLENTVYDYVMGPQAQGFQDNTIRLVVPEKGAVGNVAKQRIHRAKRSRHGDHGQSNDKSSAMDDDISDVIKGVCLTEECLEVIKQYLEWRKENGYPVYTGVTSIG